MVKTKPILYPKGMDMDKIKDIISELYAPLRKRGTGESKE